MSIGTFGSFTQARLGIYAAQKGMSVTGQNIANINTQGYTRQRLEQSSIYAGNADRYYSNMGGQVGYGVMVDGVSQIRDRYLDIRYREKTADVGAAGQKLDKLTNIESILDEVGEGEDGFGVLGAQFSDVFKQLQQIIDQTGDANSDTQVRVSSEALVKMFHSYANQLEQLKENSLREFEADVDDVNLLLRNIQNLSTSIRKSEIHGDKALELRDQRNDLIDHLSEYIKIDVQYTTEDLGAGQSVEKLVIKLGDANPDGAVHTDETTLVDGIYARQLSYDKTQSDLRITVSPLKDDGGRSLYTTEDRGTEESNAHRFAAGSFTRTDPVTGVVTIVTQTRTRGKGYVTENGDLMGPEKNTGAGGDPKEFPYMGPKPNTDFDPSQKVGGENLPYLKADGGKTAELNDAAKIGVKKPEEALLVKVDDEADAMPLYTYQQQVYTRTPSYAVPLDDNDLYGSLQSLREFITEEGEFTSVDVIRDVDENAATKRGIGYYQKSLDLLANQFATQLNKANHGFLRNEKGEFLNAEGDVVKTNDYEPPKRCDQNGNEDNSGAYYLLRAPDADGRKAISIAEYEKQMNALPQLRLKEDGKTPFSCDQDGNAAEAGDYYMRSDGQIVLKKEYDKQKGQRDTLYNSLARGTEVELKGLNSYTADQMAYLHGKGVKHLGVNLFSVRGDTDSTTNAEGGITASNISISRSWSLGPSMVRSYVQPDLLGDVASTDSSNLLHMLTLFTTKLDYDPTVVSPDADNTPMFNGSFQEMWENVGSVLSDDISVTGVLLDNYESTALDLDTQRMSVSSVDLNDEAMSLMQYSKSYNAACRLMTTLDSMLDKLINGTGMTT